MTHEEEQLENCREAERMAREFERLARVWDGIADQFTDAQTALRFRNFAGRDRQHARNLRAMMAQKTIGVVQ